MAVVSCANNVPSSEGEEGRPSARLPTKRADNQLWRNVLNDEGKIVHTSGRTNRWRWVGKTHNTKSQDFDIYNVKGQSLWLCSDDLYHELARRTIPKAPVKKKLYQKAYSNAWSVKLKKYIITLGLPAHALRSIEYIHHYLEKQNILAPTWHRLQLNLSTAVSWENVGSNWKLYCQERMV